MCGTKVVSLQVVREMKKAEGQDPAYHARILGMDKLELLEEMMRFQEERSQLGHLTPKMMSQGQILFKALENSAETEELKDMARSYRRHLKLELENYLKEQTLLKETK
jgi:hypothetical protein